MGKMRLKKLTSLIGFFAKSSNKGNAALGFLVIGLLAVSTFSLLEVKELVLDVEKTTDGTKDKVGLRLKQIVASIRSELAFPGKCGAILVNKPLGDAIDRLEDFRGQLIHLNKKSIEPNDVIGGADNSYWLKDIRLELPKYLTVTDNFGPFDLKRRRLVFNVAHRSDMNTTTHSESFLLNIVGNHLGTTVENCTIPGTKEDVCINVGGFRETCANPNQIDRKIMALTILGMCISWHEELGGDYDGLSCNSEETCCSPSEENSLLHNAFDGVDPANWFE